MVYRIGLTGSIGMGKSTAAKMFAEAPDVALWDADAAVHRLYGPGGAASAPMAALVPAAVGPRGVDRAVLKQAIRENPSILKEIEKIVHPLVAQDRSAFLAGITAPIAVLDIPLLFETGGADAMDLTVVVSAPAPMQRARVLDRPGMTEAQFDHILSIQMPDVEKRAQADMVIDSSTLDTARHDIDRVLIRAREAV